MTDLVVKEVSVSSQFWKLQAMTTWPKAIDAAHHGESVQTALQHHCSRDQEVKAEEEAGCMVQSVPNNLKRLHWAHFLEVLPPPGSKPQLNTGTSVGHSRSTLQQSA